MAARRTAPVIGFVLVALLGASVSAQTPGYDVDELLPMQHVTGSMVLDAQGTFGAFSASDRIYHHRDVPKSGTPIVMSDPRLTGRLESMWNWDIHASGKMPVPAWGTMRIDVPALSTVKLGGSDGATVEVGLDQGSWSGSFSGIRRADDEPFAVRAFLVGEGAYDGLCAVLDIEADDRGWLADGVIHLAPAVG